MSPTQDLTRQLHENLWLVLSFAFGQPAVAKVVNDRFVGEFKYLWKTIDSIAEATANRALKDIGNQLRELDKRYPIPPTLSVGSVIQEDRKKTELYPRDLANKIAHSLKFEWRLDPSQPSIVIHSDNLKRWQIAEVNLEALMVFMSQLMH